MAAETAEAMSPASDPTGFDGIFVSRVQGPPSTAGPCKGLVRGPIPAMPDVGTDAERLSPAPGLSTESSLLTSFAGSATDDSEGFVEVMIGTNVPVKGSAPEGPSIDWSAVPRPGPVMSSLSSRHW